MILGPRLLQDLLRKENKSTLIDRVQDPAVVGAPGNYVVCHGSVSCPNYRALIFPRRRAHDTAACEKYSTIELDVTVIKGAVDIGANDVTNGGQTVNFPKLESAGQLTFRNSSSVMLPSLANVSENLGFYDNLFASLATPNLTFAGGIVFVDNTMLSNISMPMLTTINGTNGTYQIANNTLLKSIDGFENLSNVKGGLDFTGNFSSVHLPKLSNVGGAMNVQTSSQFNCDPIEALGSQGNQVVKGAITCAGSESQPGNPSSAPSGTATGSSPTGSASSAASALNLPSAVGGVSIFAGLLQLLLSF